MGKLIRYFFIGLGTLVLLVVLAVVIFVVVFDANAYKEDISKLVREQTGRELQFEGDIGLTIYPALGMELGAMSFSNAAGFGEQPMARVGLASVSVDLLSLLRFTPEIDKLILRDLEINLIRNKAGATNWDDLAGRTSTPAAGSATGSSTPSQTSSQQTPAQSPQVGMRGALAGIEIDNLKLLWRDERAGEEYRVTDLDISTGRIAPNESFPLTLHLDASGSGDLDIVFDLQTLVDYQIEQQQLTLGEIKLALNEFQLEGQLQVSNFAKPALRFDLASETVDVDALLDIPPASAQQPAAPAQQQDGAATAQAASVDEDIQILLPKQLLRDLDIDGDLAIGSLKMMNMQVTDLEMHLSAKNGLVALKPVRMKAYSGEVATAVVVDVRSEVPKYGIDKKVKGIQVGELLNDYMGEAPISGDFNLEANISSSGEWLSKLKKNSNGVMSLGFFDGALHGVNIRHSIEVARAKFRREDPPREEARKTDFSSLTISGVIENGVFSSDDLDLQAPVVRAGGKGSADLNREYVDYLVDAKLVGTSKGQQGGSADELAGISIPVRIEGPFSAPEFDVQLDELMKAKLEAEKAKLKAEAEARKAELKAEIEAQKKALEKQLEEEKRALEAEKKALEEAQRREQEAKIELEKAKAKKKLDDKLKNLFD